LLIDVVEKLLCLNPAKRTIDAEALEDPVFAAMESTLFS
jgi:hypothetical protein